MFRLHRRSGESLGSTSKLRQCDGSTQLHMESEFIRDRPIPQSCRSKGCPAPVFRRDVGKSFREGPVVSRRIFYRVLPLAEREISRLHHDPRSPRASARAVCGRVLYTHDHGVCGFSGPRWPAFSPHVADDYGSISETELRSVVVTDPDALLEPECTAQPVDRRADIRIDENRNNRRLWNRAIVLHVWFQNTPAVCFMCTEIIEYLRYLKVQLTLPIIGGMIEFPMYALDT